MKQPLREASANAYRLLANAALSVVLVALLAVNLGLLHSVRVESINMSPTLVPEDRIFVRAWGTGPGRGDVIAYRSPFSDRLLVGRLVATAGERVALDEGGLRIDGLPVEAGILEAASGLVATESIGSHRYVTRRAGSLASLHFAPRVVPDGHVFVLNDNRIDERDSRIYGAIPVAAVVGVASIVYYASDQTGIRWDRMSRRVS